METGSNSCPFFFGRPVANVVSKSILLLATNPLTMKNFLLTLSLLILSTTVFAGDFLRELENSIKCRDCPVTYTLHLADGTEKVFTNMDFSSGNVVTQSGVPYFLELYEGAGEKKHNIMINISQAVWYRFDIEKSGGKWAYDFHFYYNA